MGACKTSESKVLFHSMEKEPMLAKLKMIKLNLVILGCLNIILKGLVVEILVDMDCFRGSTTLFLCYE